MAIIDSVNQQREILYLQSAEHLIHTKVKITKILLLQIPHFDLSYSQGKWMIDTKFAEK